MYTIGLVNVNQQVSLRNVNGKTLAILKETKLLQIDTWNNLKLIFFGKLSVSAIYLIYTCITGILTIWETVEKTETEVQNTKPHKNYWYRWLSNLHVLTRSILEKNIYQMSQPVADMYILVVIKD